MRKLVRTSFTEALTNSVPLSELSYWGTHLGFENRCSKQRFTSEADLAVMGYPHAFFVHLSTIISSIGYLFALSIRSYGRQVVSITN